MHLTTGDVYRSFFFQTTLWSQWRRCYVFPFFSPHHFIIAKGVYKINAFCSVHSSNSLWLPDGEPLIATCGLFFLNHIYTYCIAKRHGGMWMVWLVLAWLLWVLTRSEFIITKVGHACLAHTAKSQARYAESDVKWTNGTLWWSGVSALRLSSSVSSAQCKTATPTARGARALYVDNNVWIFIDVTWTKKLLLRIVCFKIVCWCFKIYRTNVTIA